MAGYADLVAMWNPYRWSAKLFATAGTTWVAEHQGYVDRAGEPVDWTGVTGTCEVFARDTGATVTTVAVTFPAPGAFTLTKPAAQTAGIAPGLYGIRLRLSHAEHGVVQIIGGPDSTLTVYPA